jgi:PAS domain S-box-containing protein
MGRRGRLFGRRKDGTLFPVEAGISKRSENGKLLYTAVVRDITERNRAEAELHASEERHRQLFENSREALMTLAPPSWRFTGANRATLELFGAASAAEFTALGPWNVSPERQPDGQPSDAKAQEAIATAVREGKHFFEWEHQRLDGTPFAADVLLTRMDVGGEAFLQATVRDITERKRAEQAMRRLNQELETRVEERTLSLVAARDAAQLANRAKDSFLATTSHEIRTPLGGLMGMLELVSLTPLSDEQRETLQAARDSGRSLQRILDDLLDWSKIEEGKLELAPQPTSIAKLVAEVVNTYARVASARSLVLEQEVDARLSPVLIVDPLRLSQVLNNFVSNALKFTHQGGVELRAELLGRRERTEQVRFSVRDTGIGIEKEVQQRLFQNYGQGSAETARMYGGTGLGLAICRRLADLLDGRIEVESAPGRGSTFSITLSLPVAEAAVEDVQGAREADAAASVLPLVHAGAQAEAPLVLVVDDHPINRRLLAQQLELLGLRAEAAEDGQAALPMWRDGGFALVITDCHMPKMDGYALARAIRRIEAEEARPRMPIFAWTANALADEEGHCRIAGMDELLIKPAELTQLRAVLSKWLAAGATMAPGPVDAGHDGSGGAAAAPIDLAALDQIAANAADRAEFLRDFMAQTRSDLTELEAALITGDLAASGRLAHRMKGACRMVGARELETACEALQGAARQRNPEEARAAKAALDLALARLEAHLAQAAGANKAEE